MPTAYDLITLADLKVYSPKVGTKRDDTLERYISAASRSIEAELGRRVRYRAPAAVEGAANIVAAVALADGALTVVGQPTGGRTAIVTVTDPDRSVAGGRVTFTGTVDGIPGATEVIDLANGLIQHTLKFFTAYSSIVVSDLVAGNSPDLIKIGSSQGYIEFHTTDAADPCVLFPLEWPVRNILEVNEDPAQAFGASTKLAATDYLLTRFDGARMDRSTLWRLSSALPIAWLGGWRGSKLVNSAGFTADGVPEDIKDVCRRLTSLLFDEVESNRFGLSGQSDAAGNWTRFATAALNAEMRAQLAPYKRRTHGVETGGRDFDLEAA